MDLNLVFKEFEAIKLDPKTAITLVFVVKKYYNRKREVDSSPTAR